MTCDICDFANSAGAGYCKRCGAPLTPSDSHVACAICHYANRSIAAYCRQCGAPLARPEEDLPGSSPSTGSDFNTTPLTGVAAVRALVRQALDMELRDVAASMLVGLAILAGVAFLMPR